MFCPRASLENAANEGGTSCPPSSLSLSIFYIFSCMVLGLGLSFAKYIFHIRDPLVRALGSLLLLVLVQFTVFRPFRLQLSPLLTIWHLCLAVQLACFPFATELVFSWHWYQTLYSTVPARVLVGKLLLHTLTRVALAPVRVLNAVYTRFPAVRAFWSRALPVHVFKSSWHLR